MKKTVAFLAVLCIFLLFMFVTFSYLITTIHPHVSNGIKNSSAETNSHKLRASKLAKIERQGFQKARKPNTKKKMQARRFEDTALQELFSEDNSFIDFTNNSKVTREPDIQEYKVGSTSLTEMSSDTGNSYRRSSQNSSNNDTENLIFKIVNNEGNPTIEIKISKDFGSKRTKNKYHKMSNEINIDNSQRRSNSIPKAVVMQLMPNNTLLVDSKDTEDTSEIRETEGMTSRKVVSDEIRRPLKRLNTFKPRHTKPPTDVPYA